MKIAIQGVAGSFHALAAEKLFGRDITLVFCTNFPNVFKALEQGEANRAIVACENSLYGSIQEVFDLLLTYGYPVVGEHIEHIHQQLIGWDHANINEITEVYSHPVALDQCRKYLDSELPKAELIEHDDTASAVKFIKENNLRNAAAIASCAAAKLYGLPILASDIEDEKTNLTRFLVLNTQSKKSTLAPTRAMFVLITTHKPGALYRALGILNDFSVNLTRLESRPIRGEAFRYQFFIDANIDGVNFLEVKMKLELSGNKIEILGIF